MNLIYFLPPKLLISVTLSILFFKVWNVAGFSICEKVLTESHPDIAHIARCKQHMAILIQNLIGVYIFWWPCSDQYKGTWYMQTFLCQLLCGHSKNQFFHYFGLLNDLLHGQYLLNKWFGRKLKLLIMFPSIFGKLISQVWFYCSNFQGNIDMTLELFHLSVIPISCIWVESLFGLFFQQLLLKIQYHIDQELQLALHIQESLRGVLQKFHQLH